MGDTRATQKRFTNVAVVRIKKGGKVFEIAAYKNKVVNWRHRVETDINEVLQVPSVFTNISHGVLAKSSELLAAFGTDDHLRAATAILEKGDLETGELERAAQFDALFRDIAATVAEKCVNPATQRPYPPSFIEKALREVHFACAPSKSAKQQSLKAVTALQAIIPIERAKMQLRVTMLQEEGGSASTALPAVRAWLSTLSPDVAACLAVAESGGGSGGGANARSFDLLVDPGLYRVIEEGLKLGNQGSGGDELPPFGGFCGGVGTVEVMSLSASMTASAASAAVGGGDGGGPSSGSAAVLRSSWAASSDATQGGGEQSVTGVTAATAGVYDDAAAAAARGTGMSVRRVTLPGKRALACNACSTSFDSPEAHREHHRSDWHRANLKLKLKGIATLTEDDFDGLTPSARAALLVNDV